MLLFFSILEVRRGHPRDWLLKISKAKAISTLLSISTSEEIVQKGSRNHEINKN